MTNSVDHRQAFDFRETVPWGRNREEYAAFFELAALPPTTRILDCAAGPSSFAADMAGRCRRIVAIDPLYGCSAGTIAGRVEETAALMLDGLRRAQARFVWDLYGTPETLIAARRAAMQRFLDDFGQAAGVGRYVAATLPALPFRAGTFDLVLCSHFLFLYGGLLDGAFHARAIEEMLRVGREARVFPLLGLDGELSPHLEPVRRRLEGRGCVSELRRVDYEFQRGGNRMLCVRRKPD
ncbi:MAG: class I SAM-dependent methyltransferase [Dongiaceae bacterium]